MKRTFPLPQWEASELWTSSSFSVLRDSVYSMCPSPKRILLPFPPPYDFQLVRTDNFGHVMWPCKKSRVSSSLYTMMTEIVFHWWIPYGYVTGVLLSVRIVFPKYILGNFAKIFFCCKIVKYGLLFNSNFRVVQTWTSELL